MGGFFGAVSDRDVALDVFFGTDYHSHLGTRRGGMVLFDKEEGFQRQIHNIENTPFRTKFERDLADFRGGPVLVVSHGDMIRSLLCYLLEVELAQFRRAYNERFNREALAHG